MPVRPLFRHPVFLLWLCAFAWWAGRWFWVWWPAPVTSVPVPSSLAVADAGRLMSAQVFGQGMRAEVSTEVFRLVGVNTDARMGFALLDIQGKPVAYQRGESLPDGRRIKDIAADRIILERGEALEFLLLERSR